MNTVTLSIEEYNRLKEAHDHRKEVKITTTFKNLLEADVVGQEVQWESDGACWYFLAGKLDRAGIRLTNKIQELKKLKQMSRREFRKWQKEELDICAY